MQHINYVIRKVNLINKNSIYRYILKIFNELQLGKYISLSFLMHSLIKGIKKRFEFRIMKIQTLYL